MKLKLILFVFCFLLSLNLRAFDEFATEEYLIVNFTCWEDNGETGGCVNYNKSEADLVTTFNVTENGFSKRFRISNDFTIVNHGDNKIEFRYPDFNEIYPLTALKSLEFIVEDKKDGIKKLEVIASHTGWKIYTLDGLLVGCGDSGTPTLSILDKGKVYLIVDNGRKYKYLRLR